MQYAIFAAIFWGLWGFLQKKAINNAHPFQLQMFNALFGIFLLPIYYFYLQYFVKFNENKISLLWAIPASICSSAAGFYFLKSIKSSSNIGAITAIGSSYPVITLFLSYFFFKENITLLKLIGVILIILGIIILSK